MKERWLIGLIRHPSQVKAQLLEKQEKQNWMKKTESKQHGRNEQFPLLLGVYRDNANLNLKRKVLNSYNWSKSERKRTKK